MSSSPCKFPSTPEETKAIGVKVLLGSVCLAVIGIVFYVFSAVWHIRIFTFIGTCFISWGASCFYFGLMFSIAHFYRQESVSATSNVNEMRTATPPTSGGRTHRGETITQEFTTVSQHSGLPPDIGPMNIEQPQVVMVQEGRVEVKFVTKVVGDDDIPPSYDEVIAALREHGQELTSTSSPVFH